MKKFVFEIKLNCESTFAIEANTLDEAKDIAKDLSLNHALQLISTEEPSNDQITYIGDEKYVKNAEFIFDSISIDKLEKIDIYLLREKIIRLVENLDYYINAD